MVTRTEQWNALEPIIEECKESLLLITDPKSWQHIQEQENLETICSADEITIIMQSPFAKIMSKENAIQTELKSSFYNFRNNQIVSIALIDRKKLVIQSSYSNDPLIIESHASAFLDSYLEVVQQATITGKLNCEIKTKGIRAFLGPKKHQSVSAEIQAALEIQVVGDFQKLPFWLKRHLVKNKYTKYLHSDYECFPKIYINKNQELLGILQDPKSLWPTAPYLLREVESQPRARN